MYLYIYHTKLHKLTSSLLRIYSLKLLHILRVTDSNKKLLSVTRNINLNHNYVGME